MKNPIVHFEILGHEGRGLASFDRELFGWELRDVDMEGYENYAYLPAPDEGIGGGVGQVTSDGAGLVTIYVEVADPQAVLDEAVRAGAQVVLPVTELARVGAIARFRDPEGNIVGVVRSAASG